MGNRVSWKVTSHPTTFLKCWCWNRHSHRTFKGSSTASLRSCRQGTPPENLNGRAGGGGTLFFRLSRLFPNTTHPPRPKRPFYFGGAYNSQNATRRMEAEPAGGAEISDWWWALGQLEELLLGGPGEPVWEGGRRQDGVGKHYGLVSSYLGPPCGAGLGRGRV